MTKSHLVSPPAELEDYAILAPKIKVTTRNSSNQQHASDHSAQVRFSTDSGLEGWQKNPSSEDSSCSHDHKAICSNIQPYVDTLPPAPLL